MNRLLKKWKGFLVLLALLPFAVGCEVAIGLSVIGAGAPTYYYGTMPDAEGMVRSSIEKTEEVTMAVAEEMDIGINDKKQKTPGEILLIGKSLRHKKVHIRLTSFSKKLTKVQVKARKRKFPLFDGKDHTFATTVLARISEQCGGVFIGEDRINALTDANPATSKIMLRVVREGLIRTGPGPKYKVITVVTTGTTLFNLGQKQGSWYKVKTEKGKVGFIYYTIVKPAEGI